MLLVLDEERSRSVRPYVVYLNNDDLQGDDPLPITRYSYQNTPQSKFSFAILMKNQSPPFKFSPKQPRGILHIIAEGRCKRRHFYLGRLFWILCLYTFILLDYSTLYRATDNKYALRQTLAKIALEKEPDLVKKKTVVVYTGPTSLARSIGKNELYLDNFEYFLSHGGIDCDKHDTIVTLSDETYSFYMDNNKLLKQFAASCGSALTVLRRKDTCYDLGSVHLVTNTVDLTKYKYFVYLNCGVVGPLWWGNDVSFSSLPWTYFFTSLLNDQVKMSGLSINCKSRSTYSTHIQSMAFALDQQGLETVLKSGAIYDCKQSNTNMDLIAQQNLIERYELGMSRAILDSGYNIASWLSTLGAHNRNRPLVIDNSDDHHCRDVWYADQFLRISGGYPSASDSMNLTFFKTSRFITPDILDEVGYKMESKEMKELELNYRRGLNERFLTHHRLRSTFVE